MSRSLFVSYVYEDKKHYDDIKRWSDERLLGEDVVVTSETADVRQNGNAAIEAHLKQRIKGAAAVLVLIGNDTHNHDWVRQELAWATSNYKQVIAARIPGTTGPAPVGFRHLSLVSLDPSAIRRALSDGR